MASDSVFPAYQKFDHIQMPTIHIGVELADRQRIGAERAERCRRSSGEGATRLLVVALYDKGDKAILRLGRGA